jgi:hypothetical protein
MDFDITIVLSDPRHDPEFGETLFEGFLAAGCDPVVGQDANAQEATVHIDVSADDAASATKTAVAILCSIVTSQPLVPTAIHVAAATEPAPQAA